jgi:hypothetical protein
MSVCNQGCVDWTYNLIGASSEFEVTPYVICRTLVRLLLAHAGPASMTGSPITTDGASLPAVGDAPTATSTASTGNQDLTATTMADDGAHGPPQDDVSMRGEAQNGGYAPSNGGEQDGQGDKDDGYRGEKMVKVLSLSPFLRSWNWDCARSGGLVGSVLHDGYVAAGFGAYRPSLAFSLVYAHLLVS